MAVTKEGIEDIATVHYNNHTNSLGNDLDDYVIMNGEQSIGAAAIFDLNNLKDYVPGSLDDFIDWVWGKIKEFVQWLIDLFDD